VSAPTSPAWHRSLPAVAVGIVAVIAVLYLAKPVIVPLALAILFTFVLAPVVDAGERFGLHRVLAVALTVLLTVCVLGGTGWIVGSQVRDLATELPRHKQEIRDKIDRLRGSGEGPFGEILKMVRDLTEGPTDAGTAAQGDKPPAEVPVRPVVLAEPKESEFSRIVATISPIVEPLASAALVLVLVIFMLINKEDLRDRLLGMPGHGRLSHTTRALDDATGRVGRYLLSLLAINVSFGVLVAIGLWFIGVPYAFLWGLLGTALRFIPYLGTWMAICFPALVSIAFTPGWAQPIEVLVLFVVLDAIAANVAEPIVFGHGTGVSPIALLVAAAFWAWLWGPLGLLLATPLTVCVVVLGQHVPRLGFLSLLLGNAPALPPPARLYQRLLARDRREASARVAEYAAEHGVDAAFDEMIIPALVLARRDRQQGGLTAPGEDFALAAVRDIVAEVGSGLPTSREPAPPARVVACAAHHPAEEPTLDMLARLLGPDGIQVDVAPARFLPSNVADRIAEVQPAAVFVSVLPPGGLPQAAYLCRLFRKRFPKLKIVVGWWGSDRKFDKLLVRLRKAGASYVTTTLKQARTQLRFLIDVAPSFEREGTAVGAAPAPGGVS
jgi:predicted PurR-regulated permease PerM